MLRKTQGLCRNIFIASQCCRPRPRLLKLTNNRLTRRSRSGEHGRLGGVIEQEKCHAVAR